MTDDDEDARSTGSDGESDAGSVVPSAARTGRSPPLRPDRSTARNVDRRPGRVAGTRVDRRTVLGVAACSLTGLAGCQTARDDVDGREDDRLADDSEGTEPRRDPYELDPGEYRVLAVFRNDDPHPGYQEAALADVDRVFVDAEVPLTHGVIPAAPGNPLDGDSEFCRTFRRRDAAYPGLFEYSLHGHDHQVHTDFHGASEFGDRPESTQRELVAEGSTLLAGCVGRRPTTFVPPYNTYDSATVRALLAEDVRIVSGGRWFTSRYYGTDEVPFEADGALHVPGTHDFVADWETLAFHSTETMLEGFDAVHERGGLYVPMLHYQHFTSERRLETLRAVLDHALERDGVGFTTLGSFGTAYLEGDLERTAEGWRYDPD